MRAGCVAPCVCGGWTVHAVSSLGGELVMSFAASVPVVAARVFDGLLDAWLGHFSSSRPPAVFFGSFRLSCI